MSTRRMRRPRQIVMVMLVAAGIGHAAEAPMTARDLERRAVAALQAGDLTAATADLRAALDRRPDHPRLLYNLTCCHALAGRTDDAIATLGRLARMEVDFGARRDPDLAVLHDDPRWPTLMARFDEASQPTENGTVAFTLPRADFVPEGIAYDARSRRFFVGSMRDGSILAIDEAGRATPFASCEDENPMACLGLRVDPPRGRLWAAASAMAPAIGYAEEDAGRTALLAFDLDAGQEVERIPLPGRHPGQGFNDLVVAPNGDLYLGGGGVYRVRAGAPVPETLELVGPGDEIDSANGLAISPDGETLYVAVYAVGVAVVELASGRYEWLASDDGATLQGTDGLYLHDGFLLTVQNGVRPWRIACHTLDPGGRRAVASRVLERARPIFAEPLTGAIRGDAIYVLGRGPAPETPPPGTAEGLAGWLGDTLVLRVPLRCE